jgi:NAD(P)-dependent dehydrogenase (short-subunit alcohol dehydrogenase family)
VSESGAQVAAHPEAEGRLRDRVALVTGAGSGIGEAIAIRFGREGAIVIATDLRAETAEQTAATIRRAGGVATSASLDVTVEGAARAVIADVLAAHGRLDVLVNNAGGSVGDGPQEMQLPTWDRMIRLNLTGAFLCIQAALPPMLDQRSGSIVNISSVTGLLGVGEEPYGAAKAGLINLTRNIAIRYGSSAIRCNVICPGTIQTPNWAERIAARPDIIDRLGRWYPLGHIGQPDDVAAAALFLASDESTWISGITLPVDGGVTAGLPWMMADLAG